MLKIKRKEKNINLVQIGKIIESKRKALCLKKGRELFISDRVLTGLLPEDWISEKSLTNIELGNNLPSLPTLKNLAIALEVDFIELLKEIYPFIPYK